MSRSAGLTVATGDAEREMLALPEDVCLKFLRYAQRIVAGEVDPARLQPFCGHGGVEAFLAQLGDCQIIFAVERLTPDGAVAVTVLYAQGPGRGGAPVQRIALDRLRDCFP
jgi:hypothetical protein